MPVIWLPDTGSHRVWRWIAVTNGDFLQNELGERPESRRLAFRREHALLALFFGMIHELSKDGSADHQCQQSRHYLNLHDVSLLGFEFTQRVPRL